MYWFIVFLLCLLIIITHFIFRIYILADFCCLFSVSAWYMCQIGCCLTIQLLLLMWCSALADVHFQLNLKHQNLNGLKNVSVLCCFLLLVTLVNCSLRVLIWFLCCVTWKRSNNCLWAEICACLCVYCRVWTVLFGWHEGPGDARTLASRPYEATIFFPKNVKDVWHTIESFETSTNVCSNCLVFTWPT